ncbi:DUF1343 domain-containing protein [Longimicrobium sp.]|uniref:exo-beta-N-acetylmuramidase NamZ family protein n=1 Tax=Longimicrobium sp. TaxID=2029185 RepID=UPI002CDB3F36|nr:DUF1343 domain-containing protein [Longimicrobium sp.]HSU16874.1 DUF1343 domain-containing protein [Longimicrobium sp.]
MRRQPAHVHLLAALAIAASAACRSASPPQRDGAADSLPTPNAGSAEQRPAAQHRVLPGLEVLVRDSMALIRGRRVGLITNQTAVTSTGQHAVDLLARTPGVRLVALFGPEHGVRGTYEGGARVENQVDSATGIPVFSLYGRTQKPTPEMLRGIDVLMFDIQDIGARPYTFVWTMALAMEAAAAQHIPFIVLDRPNPITSAAQGPMMAMEIRTEHVGQAITGLYPVPLRHGMTVGEVARYVNDAFRVGADLHVIRAEGWEGDEWFDATGLRWVNPSPNIRSLDAALKYSGLVLAEATNVAVGRGTDAPFSYLGAPWMNAGAVLAAVAKYDLQGVRLDSVTLTPSGAQPHHMIRLTVTDREKFDAPFATLALLTEIRRLHPQQFKIEDPPGMTQMLGSRWAMAAFQRGDDPRTIQRRWQEELRAWRQTQERYRLYRD